MAADLKTVLDDACDIYISNLSLKNSWPNTTKMAEEAVLQANHHSRQSGGEELDLESSSILRKVCTFISMLFAF